MKFYSSQEEKSLGKECLHSQAGLWIKEKIPEESVIRELKEECGIDGEVVKILCVRGKPTRDPRGHVVSLAYLVSADGEPTAGDDAASASWYKISEVEEMAGDHLSILNEVDQF